MRPLYKIRAAPCSAWRHICRWWRSPGRHLPVWRQETFSLEQNWVYESIKTEQTCISTGAAPAPAATWRRTNSRGQTRDQCLSIKLFEKKPSFGALTLMFRYDECLRWRLSLGVLELESSERVSERERSFSAFVLVSQNCIGPCCSAAEWSCCMQI